jgi:hypothetical protein
MLVSLLIALLVLAIVCWIISILPLPASRFPIKTVLYIIVAIIAIAYLLRVGGLA